MNPSRIFACGLVIATAFTAHAEEIWLHDNSRIYGLVREVTPQGRIVVLQASGQRREVALDEVIAIRFLGRSPLLIESGTQEFRFVDGSSLRGQILYNEADRLHVATATAGQVEIDLAHLKGFVALPLVGFSGRKAEELVETPHHKQSAALDVVLDRRGSTYPGVIRRLSRTDLELDHEELLQVVNVRVLYVAGVRLADAGRSVPPVGNDSVRIRLRARDGSIVVGTLREIQLGKWQVTPAWNLESTLSIDVEEIAQVQVLGGRVQYLSHVPPVEVEESTVLSPPQPYRIDQSSQGDPITIAGKRYPWGIGVHAHSKLTFELAGRFREFRSDVGLSSRTHGRGSVVFVVSGDGRELFNSGKVTGDQPTPIEVRANVSGVQRLTLEVSDAGDLDLGDVANWGSARAIR